MNAATNNQASHGVHANPARFTGRYPGKIDAKGRIVVPPEFRQRLTNNEIFVFPHFDEPLLQCGDDHLVSDLLSALGGLDEFDDDRAILEEEITGGVMRIVIDETGRTGLPKLLRDHAALEGSLGFAGRGQHFVLGTAAYLDERRGAARAAAQKHRETLRARMLPSVRSRRSS
ncbi:MAG: hypothetical protein AAF511_05665 [Pseudomonadota bacterium]